MPAFVELFAIFRQATLVAPYEWGKINNFGKDPKKATTPLVSVFFTEIHFTVVEDGLQYQQRAPETSPMVVFRSCEHSLSIFGTD